MKAAEQAPKGRQRKSKAPQASALKVLVEDFVLNAVETGGMAAPNFIISILTPAAARSYGMKDVDDDIPEHVVIAANASSNKDAFCLEVGSALWQAGADEICFVSDVWFSTVEKAEDMKGLTPSKDPNHKHAWMALHLSRSTETDALFVQYEVDRVVDRSDWGSDQAKSFCGPLFEILLLTLVMGAGFDAGLARKH